LFKYAKGEVKEIPQDENQVSRCYKIKKEDGQITPFEDTLESIWRKYKAFVLWPGIFFNVENL
jgi:methionyl-tRNA formyltransferase